MKNKFKIIETEDYILAVSDEAGNQGVYRLEYMPHKPHCYTRIYCNKLKNSTVALWDKGIWKGEAGFTYEIIGYQPKGNTPELELPFLPQIIVKNDVEKLFIEKSNIPYFPSDLKETCNWWFKEGYKSATKKYSEGDLYTAFNVGRTYEKSNHKGVGQSELIDYIQSLNQPKWFVADRQKLYHAKRKGITEFQDTKGYYYWILKTETNSEGKPELVGTYLYE